MTRRLSLKDLSVKNRRILMRVDFNVPLDQKGEISDDTRLREALPSIQYILKEGGCVILISHLGKPNGKPIPQLSLEPCAKALSHLLNLPVLFASDCIGPRASLLASSLKAGEVLLLENLRFHPAEETPSLDPSFAKKLASLGDIYVDDAFGTAHRAHSSIVSIVRYFPQRAATGFLMEKEISFLSSLLSDPKRPFYALIGGAKISSKIGILHSLLSKVDGIFIGGGMAFTFLKAQGISIGNSIYEENLLGKAKDFLSSCSARSIPLWLPQDLVIADAFREDAAIKIVSTKEGIPPEWQGMDIGPETLSEWQKILKKTSTVFWNGPLGVFEFPHFAKGTHAIARTLADLKAMTIVGGGDSIAAINQLHIADQFSHLSTGGGASLEFLENGSLPGIDALSEKIKN